MRGLMGPDPGPSNPTSPRRRSRRRAIFYIVLGLLVAALGLLVLGFACHVYCLSLYQRWQGRTTSPGLFARAALATLTEPYFFQLLRQVGAFLGWVAFVRGRIEWAPQREPEVVE